MRIRVSAVASTVVLVMISACSDIKDLGKREVMLSATTFIDREDNLLIDDRYRFNVSFFHTEGRAIKGKYVVRAFGDVFGEGGQSNSDLGDNYDETPERMLEPGKASAVKLYYYINNQMLKLNNHDPRGVKQEINMRIEIDFIPSPDDRDFRISRYKLIYANGAATIGTRD